MLGFPYLQCGLKLLAELKMKWNGKMTIQYFIQDQVYVYTLQHQGFFKNSYLLLDPAGHGLIHITVDSTWNKNNYEFQCSEVFALISNHILLLFTSLFGVQQYYKRMEG